VGHCQTGVDLAITKLAAAKDELQKGRLAADAKQMQLKQREMRIDDLTAKLNACSSNREFQTLKEQIAADRQANAVQEDEILEALERNDELVEAAAERQREVEANEQELARVSERVENQRQALAAELARVETELAEAEEHIPEDMIVEYRRVSGARGADALAEVDGEFCGGCCQKMTSQTKNELLLGAILFCRRCGCLMYLPE